MRQFFKLLLVATFLVMATSLVGCGGRDEALVGTWTWDGNPDYLFTFNSDGTGRRGGGANHIETFTWSTSGDTLRVNLDNAPFLFDVRNERWNYTVRGNTLTIDSLQTANRGEIMFTYTRR